MITRGTRVRAYHEQTKHRPGVIRGSPRGVPRFVPMDPSNRPAPFKRYAGAPLQPLPTDLLLEGPPAIEVLAGSGSPEPAAVHDELLAKLLFFSGGVTRILGDGRRRLYFRAAASAILGDG